MFESLKVKIYAFSNAQKRVPNLLFNIDRMHIEQVTEFNFLGLIIDSNLNWKAHLNAISTKISRIIGLLHKLKYIFPKQVLHSIYNSLIMPYLNYSLLAWGIKSHKIEQLQKKAIRVLYSKSPIAHTEPLFITRCTRGDARIFFLYSQNVFVCTKENFLRIYSNIVLKILLNCMNLQNMI